MSRSLPLSTFGFPRAQPDMPYLRRPDGRSANPGTIEKPVADEHELWACESDPDTADVRRAEVVERYQQ